MNRNPPRPRPIMRVSGNRSLREASWREAAYLLSVAIPFHFVSLSFLPFSSLTAAQPGAEKREFR